MTHEMNEEKIILSFHTMPKMLEGVNWAKLKFYFFREKDNDEFERIVNSIHIIVLLFYTFSDGAFNRE